MKLVKLFLVLCFFGFISGLMAVSLATRKQSDDAEKPSDFKFTTFVQPSYGGRSQDIKTLFQNSSAGEFFIGRRYAFDAASMQTVNSDRVASGRNRDWLFYRDQFNICYSQETIDQALYRIAVLRIIAEGADIRFNLSVSPDKGLIYQDKLSPQQVNRSRCKLMNAMYWRSRNGDTSANIFDFYPYLMKGRQFQDVYFPNDTHWNDFGQYVSLEPYLTAVFGGRSLGTEKISENLDYSRDKRHIADLSRMLRWNNNKLFEHYSYEGLPNIRIKSSIYIVHDSFFNNARTKLLKAVPDGDMIHFEWDAQLEKLKKLTVGDYILVNTVERNLFYRFPGTLKESSPSSPFFRKIIGVNSKLAEDCEFIELKSNSIIMKNIHHENELIVLNKDAGFEFIIPLSNHSQKVCFRIKYQSQKSKKADTIYLSGQDGNFQAGFEFDTLFENSSSSKEFQLVLPPEFSGRKIKYDFGGGSDTISGLSVQTGVYRPETAQ